MIYSNEELINMLEDVITVLDPSGYLIAKHGPLGTPPAEIVREVLHEKDMIIAGLRNEFKCINLSASKKDK